MILLVPSILPARREAKGVLTVHGPDRVPVEADMAGHRIDVAPGPLYRVAEMQAIAAGRSVERLDRLDGELGDPGLVAAAADAVGDGDLLARIELLRHVAHISQEDQFGALDRGGRLGIAQLDRRELGHRELTAGERAAGLARPRHLQIGVERAARGTHRGRGQHRGAVDQQRHAVERVAVMLRTGCRAGARIGEQQDPMRRHTSRTTISLLPVPARPQTNQLSTISQSSIGSRKKAPSKACPGPRSGGGLASGGAIKAPSLTQLEASHPLANYQVPFSTYPPSTGTAVPVGAKHAQVKGSASPSQTSRWASIGKWAIDRPLETAPFTAQPVEAQAAEIVIAILSATSPSYSKPPNSLGRQVRNSSASLILSMM